jgi:hypothetical protein
LKGWSPAPTLPAGCQTGRAGLVVVMTLDCTPVIRGRIAIEVMLARLE